MCCHCPYVLAMSLCAYVLPMSVSPMGVRMNKGEREQDRERMYCTVQYILRERMHSERESSVENVV